MSPRTCTKYDSEAGSGSGSESDSGGSSSSRSSSGSRSSGSRASGDGQRSQQGSPQRSQGSGQGSRGGSPEGSPRGSPAGSAASGRRSGQSSPRSEHSRRSRSRASSAGSGGEGSRAASGAEGSRPGSEASRHSRSRSRSGSRSGSRNQSPPKSGDDNKGSGSESDHSQAASKRKRAVLSDSGSEGSVGKSRKKKVTKGSDQEGSGNEGGGRESGSESDGSQIGRKTTRVGSDSGSEGSTKVRKKKKKRIVGSDDENSEKEDGGEVDAEALFGDADDISSEDEGKKQEEEDSGRKSAASMRSDEDIARVGGGEEEEEEERRPMPGQEEEEEKREDEPPPETIIDVEFPRISFDLGRDIHFVKLPNFLSVETRPFDKETYEDEIDEEETQDEEGRARLKLKVENTIRWRETFDREGNVVKESNARYIRWSDGSYSLHLGSEIFDVYKQPLQGDHNHLYVRQGTGLQGQAVFRTKLTFRPHSTDSFTHKKMTLSLADRSTKCSGIKMMGTVGADPDQHRGEMIKKEEERLRASLRRESKQKRVRERGATRGLSSGYLENDPDADASDDEGAISIAAIKNKYKKGAPGKNDRPNIYSSEDDGSDFEGRRGRKIDRSKPKKALKDSDESSAASGSEKSASGGKSDSGSASESEKSASGSD